MEQLRRQKLEKATRGRKTVKELIGAKARFLADYRMTNYVPSAQINDITHDGVRCKTPASVFFRDKAGLLIAIAGDECNKPFDVILFDTFIVIEVAPRTLETEFLVLVPNFESKTGSYILGDTLTTTSVADTLDAIKQSRGYAALLDEAGDLLASLNLTLISPKDRQASG